MRLAWVLVLMVVLSACSDARSVNVAGRIDRVIAVGNRLDPAFWSRFTPATETDIERIESELQIALPADFKVFYRRVGYGPFPDGGGIDSPDDIVADCGMPIYYITGSRFPGEEWTTREAHDRLWLSKGAENPLPDRFTDAVLTYDGTKLYDLLPVASDGVCGMLFLDVGSEAGAYGCRLVHQTEVLARHPDFLAALENMLNCWTELEE